MTTTLAGCPPLQLHDLCAAARAAGYTVHGGLRTATVISPAHRVLKAIVTADGAIHLSGNGSYRALAELFPSNEIGREKLFRSGGNNPGNVIR